MARARRTFLRNNVSKIGISQHTNAHISRRMTTLARCIAGKYKPLRRQTYPIFPSFPCEAVLRVFIQPPSLETTLAGGVTFGRLVFSRLASIQPRPPSLSCGTTHFSLVDRSFLFLRTRCSTAIGRPAQSGSHRDFGKRKGIELQHIFNLQFSRVLQKFMCSLEWQRVESIPTHCDLRTATNANDTAIHDAASLDRVAKKGTAQCLYLGRK